MRRRHLRLQVREWIINVLTNGSWNIESENLENLYSHILTCWSLENWVTTQHWQTKTTRDPLWVMELVHVWLKPVIRTCQVKSCPEAAGGLTDTCSLDSANLSSSSVTRNTLSLRCVMEQAVQSTWPPPAPESLVYRQCKKLRDCSTVGRLFVRILPLDERQITDVCPL